MEPSRRAAIAAEDPAGPAPRIVMDGGIGIAMPPPFRDGAV